MRPEREVQTRVSARSHPLSSNQAFLESYPDNCFYSVDFTHTEQGPSI